MTTAPDLDCSDLDLLDDPLVHAFCDCQAGPPGHPFIAFCGVRSVVLGDEVDLDDPAVNACPESLELYNEPCRLCGC